MTVLLKIYFSSQTEKLIVRGYCNLHFSASKNSTRSVKGFLLLVFQGGRIQEKNLITFIRYWIACYIISSLLIIAFVLKLKLLLLEAKLIFSPLRWLLFLWGKYPGLILKTERILKKLFVYGLLSRITPPCSSLVFRVSAIPLLVLVRNLSILWCVGLSARD